MSRLGYLSFWIKRSFVLLIPCSFVVGIIIGNIIYPNYKILLLLFVFIYLVFGKKSFIVGAFLVLGIYRSNMYSIVDQNHIVTFLGKEVSVEGEIKDYPYNKDLNKFLVLKPKKITQEGKDYSISDGLIRIKVSRFIEVEKGDNIIFEAILEEPKSNEDFDYKEYLKIQNIFAVVDNPEVKGISNNDNLYINFLNYIRKTIVTNISSEFPQPHAKLLAGMVIGTREEFSEKFTSYLGASGTSHIIAVSGYNITLIINSLLGLAGWLNRRIILFMSFVTVIVFLGIVGFDNVPALRAGLMGSITIYALLKGRKSQGLFLLLVVAAIMNFHNPLIYKSISFQLSFFATFGLMTISNTISKIVGKFLPSAISEEAGTTISAVLSTFPVTFSNFSQFGIYSVLANIVIAPFVPIASLFGIIWLLLDSIFKPIAFLFKLIVWGALEYISIIIELVSRLPYSMYFYEADPRPLSFLILIILICLVFETSYRNHIENNA